MRPLGRTLADQAFHQRTVEVWSRLERSDGDVVRARDEVLRGPRRPLEFHVAVPGFGMPLEATLVFIERYLRVRRWWELVECLYDYHREPRPSGRKGHHWHDGIFHAHCLDPRRPRWIAHFRGVPVGLLKAADEFWAIHLRGEIDCSGLFPLA